MPLSVGEIEATLRLRDEMTPALKNAVSQLDQAGRTLQQIGEKMRTVGTSLTAAITLPLGAATAAVFKFGKDFESGMLKLHTLSDISKDRLEGMRDAILKLAPETGKGPDELVHALQLVTSYGIRGSEAMDIVSESAKAAAIGLGDTGVISRTVAAAMNAYGVANLDAATATNQLYRAVVEGGAEADTFAGTLGRVMSIAQNVGVGFDEVAASVATFTRLGVGADEAVTALRGTMAIFLHPAKQTRDELERLGIPIDQLRKKIRENGLTDALIDLVKATKGNEDAIGRIIPNVRALAGVLSNAQSQADQYREILEKVRHGHLDISSSFAEVAETTAMKWDRLKAKMQVVAIEMFERLAPSFDKIIDAAVKLSDKLVTLIDWWGKLPEPIRDFSVAIAGIMIVSGPVLYWIGSLTNAIGGLIGVMKTAGFATMLGGLGAGAGAAALGVGGLALIVYEFNNRMKAMEEHVNKTGQAIPGLSAGVKGATTDLRALSALLPIKIFVDEDPMGKGGGIGKGVREMSKEMKDALEEIRLAAIPLTDAQKRMVDGWSANHISVSIMSKALDGLSEIAIQNYIDSTEEAANEANKAFHDSLASSNKAVLDAANYIGKGLNPQMEDLAVRLGWVTLAVNKSYAGMAYLVDTFRQVPFQQLEVEGRSFTETLDAVSSALGAVGDKWTSVAQGMIQQMGAVTKLWKDGFKTQAVGQAIGALGQFIPASENAAVSAAKFATQGTAIGSIFGPWTAAVGAGIGALIGWAKAAADARKANDMRDTFLASKGGLDAFNKSLHDALGPQANFLVQQLLAAKHTGEFQKALEAIDGALKKHQQQVEEVKEKIHQMGQNFNDLANVYIPQTAEELAILSSVAVASIGLALEAGYSLTEAIAMNKDGIDALIEAYERLKIPVDDVLLKTVMIQSQLIEKSPELIKGIDALTSSFALLAQFGQLNADTFSNMESLGMQMYTRLQAQVASFGGTTKDALLPMQEFLHEAERRAKDLGIPLDENLQMLIDQSKELGVWREAGKSANEKLLDGLNALVNKMNEFIDAIFRAGDAIRNMPTPAIPTPDGGGEGQGFASGTHGRLLDFGRGTQVTLHGREGVFTESDVRGMGPSNSELATEISELRRDMKLQWPSLMASALTLALVRAGVR